MARLALPSLSVRLRFGALLMASLLPAAAHAAATATASAQAPAELGRSLNVTVSPLGAWAATRVQPGAVLYGNAAALDWDFARSGSLVSMGGHVAQTARFTEATPLRVRVGPRLWRLRPFVGAGASFLLPWGPDQGGSPLRLGAEVSAGTEVTLSRRLYLASEVRLQSFSVGSEIFSRERQEVLSGYLGLGFRL